MRILAFETSGRTGSLAAVEGGESAANCLREVQLDSGGRTAQLLAPALAQLLKEAGWTAASVELVAVAAGPGSFTGLRIGVTAAKTFAYAIGAQIVGVDTMNVLAAQAPAADRSLWTIMDAQRQELFAAKFETSNAGGREQAIKTSILAEQVWLDGLSPGDYVIGPALSRLRERLPTGVHIVEPGERWQPTAAAVGHVGWQAFQAGQRDDVWKLVPQYYRASAAEEKRGRQGEGEKGRN
jgi:tRNA threonylcarbamoyladenosine biosynthesis protein TsaB